MSSLANTNTKKKGTDLLLEPRALLERIVQLGVGIAELLPTHEPFEALAQPRARAVPLGEGGHDLWVSDYEGGGDAEGFNELADKLAGMRLVNGSMG
jgi:hypothetical protein